VQMGFFGPDDPYPYITLDSNDYPLVPGSIVEGAPLNPFSPSNEDGNTVAVISQRHASEVWDDFTAGLGWRDDEPGSHKYAQGNLDTRVPASTSLPALAGNIASGSFAAGTQVWSNSPTVRGFYVATSPSDWCFIAAQHCTNSSNGVVRRITTAGMTTTAIPDTEIFRGEAFYNGICYVLTETQGGDAHLWSGATPAATLTFTLVSTVVGVSMWGLVAFDDKLITYNFNTKTFQQYSGGTWVTYVQGFVGDDIVRQLFVWTDKSGSTDALYALSNRRIMVYDDQGQQWEDLYVYYDLFASDFPFAHVNRRDNSLVVAFGGTITPSTPAGNILVFTPGTADNIQVNKGFAFPNSFDYVGGLAGLAPPVNYPMMLASGVHWMYMWCYSPMQAAYTGVYAYNEFGGWTQVYDPGVVASQFLLGGGYGAGRLLSIHGDGSFVITAMPDVAADHPAGTYDSQAKGATNTYYLRSGRVYNKQRNIKKLGSHLECTFKSPLPTGAIAGKGTAYVRWRYFNENGLSAWVQSPLFTAGAQRVSVNLSDGAGSNGISYYYMEWEVNMYMPTATNVPPVLESVVLYYTYFQSNKYAYSMNVDLTAETWAEYYPDDVFHGKTREYLQQTLLAAVDTPRYHSFTYAQLNFTESVTRADLSLARRESADDASGVYGLTVRDLEADTPAGIFVAG
jgi:hypothetical protein